MVDFPQCASGCGAVEILGVGECESCCPEKFAAPATPSPPPMPEGWRWAGNALFEDDFCGPVVRIIKGQLHVNCHGKPTPAQAAYLAHVLRVWAETGEVPRG